MKQWTEDSKVDPTSIDLELLKIPTLHSRYLNIMSYHRHMVRKIEADYKARKILKEEFYDGHLSEEDIKANNLDPHDLLSKGTRNRKVEIDKELANILLKKVAHEEIVTYCENVLKSLNNRSWDIGNFIKYKIHMDGK